MRYSDLMKIDKKVRRHFHDDITVIVLFINYDQLAKGHSQGQSLSIRCALDHWLWANPTMNDQFLWAIIATLMVSSTIPLWTAHNLLQQFFFSFFPLAFAHKTDYLLNCQFSPQTNRINVHIPEAGTLPRVEGALLRIIMYFLIDSFVLVYIS